MRLVCGLLCDVLWFVFVLCFVVGECVVLAGLIDLCILFLIYSVMLYACFLYMCCVCGLLHVFVCCLCNVSCDVVWCDCLCDVVCFFVLDA